MKSSKHNVIKVLTLTSWKAKVANFTSRTCPSNYIWSTIALATEWVTMEAQ
jgi:hypothetical protein